MAALPQAAVVHQARKVSFVLEFCVCNIVKRRHEILADSIQVSIVQKEQ
ncbi:hypothetical protein Salpa_1772 [Sporomusa sp. KB1]|jgi:hypothetical protein|nr:hypothetical protein Salpa_1772 [Sporomusa sp. KB1]